MHMVVTPMRDNACLVLFQDLSEIVQLRESAARGERLAVLMRLIEGPAPWIIAPVARA